MWICFRILSLKTKYTSASRWLFDFVSYLLARYKNENNTSIKLPGRVKLAFHFISRGRYTVKQPSDLSIFQLGLSRNRFSIPGRGKKFLGAPERPYKTLNPPSHLFSVYRRLFPWEQSLFPRPTLKLRRTILPLSHIPSCCVAQWSTDTLLSRVKVLTFHVLEMCPGSVIWDLSWRRWIAFPYDVV